MERPQRVRPIGAPPQPQLPPKAKARAMDEHYPQSRRTLVIAFFVTVILHVVVVWGLFTASGKAAKQEIIIYFDMSQKYENMPLPPRKPRPAAPAKPATPPPSSGNPPA